MQALYDLDDDGDGYIPVDAMTNFLTSLGEVFSEQEAQDFIAYAMGHKQPYNPNTINQSLNRSLQVRSSPSDRIDIKRVVEIMMPIVNARQELHSQNNTMVNSS